MGFRRINGMRSIEFGIPGESRAKLISMILDGNKRATAGLLEWDYVAQGEQVEVVGEKLAVLDNEDKHIATIEATRVEITEFSDVPDDFAIAEAEGDLNGEDFRASHYKFWTDIGYSISDQTKVVLLYFDLIEDLRK